MGQTHDRQQNAPPPEVEEKVAELVDALTNLEMRLGQPSDIPALASAYRQVRQCTSDLRNHGDEVQDINGVFETLERDDAYPAWRRQALLEAYALFFDDVAKTGDPDALRQLPEPPTSEEMGFRPFPEWLANNTSARKPEVHGAHEEFSCVRSRKWEYAIRRKRDDAGAPILRPHLPMASSSSTPTTPAGREIVSQGSSERTCPGAVDPVSNIIELILGRDACCASMRKGQPRSMTVGAPTPHAAPSLVQQRER